MLLNTQSPLNAVPPLYKPHKDSLKCKWWLRPHFTFWSAGYFISLCKVEEFQQKTLRVLAWHYSLDQWSGHSAETLGCCFKSLLRKKLFWSLTSWDSTTTTQFLGKRDATLCDKGLIGNQSGLMEEPATHMWAPPCGLVRHLPSWDGEALTPPSSLGSPAG